MRRLSFLPVALCLASAAAAQDRVALVVANAGYDGALALPEVRETALEMSETLFGLGFTVTRLENPDTEALRAALAVVQAGSGPAVIYYAGHGFAHEGGSYLLPVGLEGDAATLAGGAVPVAELFAASGTRETMVFLDICHGAASQQVPGQGALDRSLADQAGGVFNLMTVTAVQPGVACPEDATALPGLTQVLAERLAVPGLPSDEILPQIADLPPVVLPDQDVATEAPAPVAPGVWASSTLTEPFVFRTATSDVRLSAEDYAVLDGLSPAAQERLIAMWMEAGIPVDVAGASAVPRASVSTGPGSRRCWARSTRSSPNCALNFPAMSRVISMCCF